MAELVFEQTSVTQLATVCGLPLVTPDLLGVLGPISIYCGLNFGCIDNPIDFFCRSCPVLDRCQNGPYQCLHLPQLTRDIESRERQIVNFYPPQRQSDLLQVIQEADKQICQTEIANIHNPPKDETSIRDYREKVLWYWSIICAAMSPESSICRVTQPFLLPNESPSDENNLQRIYFAGAYFQVVSDARKHSAHKTLGIVGFGSTIGNPDERVVYLEQLADAYRRQALMAGVSPLVLDLFELGFSAIHQARKYLPPKAGMHPFLTA